MVLGLLAACTGGTSEPATTNETPSAATSAPTSTASAGSTGSAATGSDAAEPTAEPETAPGELTLPLAEDKLEFEIYYSAAVIGSTMSDLNDGYAFQEFEKRTNIHIDWIYPSSVAQAEQFNLIVASQIYPDSFITMGLGEYVGGLDKYIDDEVILDLKDFRPYLPNFISAIKNASVDRVEIDCYTDTGALPVIRQVNKKLLLCYAGYMVREDKLQEAGFGKAAKDVVTIDDFHDMLTALKGYSSNGTMFLGSPKGIDYMLLAAWNISADMYQVNGTVKYGPIQPEYKEYLSTVSQWYREGLIDQDFMTRTHYYVDFGLFMNGSVMVMPHVFTFLDTFQKVGSGQDPNYRVRAVPYPKLHNGDTRYISAGTTDTN